jgi:hypothetical protein
MSAPVVIDTRDRTIRTLMEEVRSGKYFLPSFQRQFVWDEDDIKDLVESIISNHPIGTIILWKPSSTSPEAVDPFSKPLVDVETPRKGGEINYIIDGQQRLTSLLLMFNSWRITREGEEIRVNPLSYDLKGKFYKGGARGIDLSKLIKAFCLKDIPQLNELTTTVPTEKLQEITDKISKILDYPISMYVMETSVEDENTFRSMAEAFIKVNKRGVRIGNLELMLSFLAGAISGDLKEKIRTLYEDLYQTFSLDLQPVVRFAFSRFGLKQTQISRSEQFKRNIAKIASYSKLERDGIFERSQASLKLAVELLRNRLGISSSYFLPSQTATVPVAAHFYKRGVTSLDDIGEEDVEAMVNWFVLASFNAHYSSQTDTKLDEDLELIDGATLFPYKDLLDNMHNRGTKTKLTLRDIEKGMDQNVLRSQGKAYLFLEYVLLVKNDADDWSGVRLRERKVDELARHHIFPQEFLFQNLDVDEPETMEVYSSNLGNITLIHKDVNSEIGEKSPFDYLMDYESSLKSHFIPTDKNLWTVEQFNTFLRFRVRQIYTSAKMHFGDIVES